LLQLETGGSIFKERPVSDGSENITCAELISKILEYCPTADVDLVSKAYYFAEKAHDGQKRRYLTRNPKPWIMFMTGRTKPLGVNCCRDWHMPRLAAASFETTNP
jgi:hypothetical protein